MKTTVKAQNQSLPLETERKSYGRVKRTYPRPNLPIGYWELQSLTK